MKLAFFSPLKLVGGVLLSVVSLTGCADLNHGNDSYRDDGYYRDRGYRHDDYYDRGREYHDRRDWERERELERERDRLSRERRHLEEERDHRRYAPPPPPPPPPPAHHDRCPPGFSPSENKCSPQERARGCKDIRTPSGLGCVHR